MCKDECRWKSLKRGITLHLSMILEKVNLLNFFFSSLSGKAKTISNKRNHKATTVFLEFLLVFNVLAYSFLIIKHQRLLWWQNEINEKRRLMNSSMFSFKPMPFLYEKSYNNQQHRIWKIFCRAFKWSWIFYGSGPQLNTLVLTFDGL